MKLDIPYYIRQVLREQKKVYVPGIGTFSLVHSSASFKNDNTDLSPPQLSLSFDDSESNDHSLLKYILDTGRLTEEKANKKIEQFIESAFNKLLNVDSFLIDGVGTISKSTGQDKVSFEPNLAELTKEFNDLRPLKLTPISRMAEMNAMTQSSISAQPVQDSGWSPLRVLLLSLLLIALWFLGKYLYENYNNQVGKVKTEVIDQQGIDDKTALSESNERELKQKYEEIDELINPLDDKGNASTQAAQVGQENNGLKGQTTIDSEGVDDLAKDNNAKEEASQQEDSKGQSSDKSIDQSKLEDVTSQNKHAEIIPESGECIIIVGSFIKSLNAIKMVSQLERKGYTVYQSEYKGFSRVGLKYDCADEDLEAYLQNIRKKISKKAWYLSPHLDVPYQK